MSREQQTLRQDSHNPRLTTHLVRDSDLAWRLRQAIRDSGLEGTVNVLALDDYVASDGASRVPDGASRLSACIDLRVRSSLR